MLREWSYRYPAVVRRGHPLAIAIALLAILMVGLLDLLTPAGVAFAQFYVVPVALVAWTHGRRSGVFFAFFAAGVELLVDSSLLRPLVSEEPLPILLWNAISSIVAFATIAVVIDLFYSERERWRTVSAERARLLGLLEREFPRPLREIDSFVRTFEEAVRPEDTIPQALREQFAGMRHHARELRFLATDLIQVGRVRSGDLNLHREPIDLAEVARESAAETIDRTRVAVIASAAVRVLADRESVRHAASAIIGRLLEHSPRGNVDLLVRVSGDEGVIEFVGRSASVLTDEELELPELLTAANGGALIVGGSRASAHISLRLRRPASTADAAPDQPPVSN